MPGFLQGAAILLRISNHARQTATVCHCLEQAVLAATCRDGTACAKQWHTMEKCGLRIRTAVDRPSNDLGVGDYRGIQRRPAPSDFNRKPREINDAPVPAEAA